MAPLSPGKLFLAYQRGRLETAEFRRICTFQFGAYVHEHKQPFGRLLALNEETLVGRHTVSLPVPVAAHVLVLPITGAVWAGVALGSPALVEVEELYLLRVEAGGTVQFTNPYETELISFLHIWLLAPVGTLAPPRKFAFDLESQPNQLVVATPLSSGSPVEQLAPELSFRVQMGRFVGRAETSCALPANAHCFAFVLAGAFEVAGRLLHAGDGLALWNTPSVELEALSNNAVVVTLALATLSS
ncbi:pirin family protein [Hymenobacter crusticola]|uniref:Quercetin 2,3-dioxygenase C-terminal cupin domain-containing protein n=1 Tax=Hymenobacter crusticola TaxID=1770526 RepID=A0A2C9ZU33_9BACT|nr:hypothetical protein [Hymenobacter crusticola]OUJ70454.1 hypothetical protein BXP70_24140 [Hymenobacter crusticola]